MRILDLLFLSATHAVRALETYITKRLGPDEQDGWTENAIITLVWFMAPPEKGPILLSPLDMGTSLDKIRQSWNNMLKPEATDAALSVSRSIYSLRHGSFS